MNSRIFPMLALILAIGIFFAYVNPTWSGPIASTEAAIAADDLALSAAASYTAEQNQLATARDNIDSASLTALTTFLPDSVDNVGLTLDLNALAARSGLSVTSIDVIIGSTGSTGSTNGASTSALPTASLNSIGSVDLSIAAVGTFASLQTFLIGVEKSARLLDIRDFAVQGSDTGVYQYQIKLRLYWLR